MKYARTGLRNLVKHEDPELDQMEEWYTGKFHLSIESLCRVETLCVSALLAKHLSDQSLQECLVG